MEWSNAMVLEFIAAMEHEPMIWNPKHPDHKKKHVVYGAWTRISKKLSWDCSVGNLKKKRDSLMSYYRIHVNKMKKGPDFKTMWFAFDSLHSFLADVYDCTSISNTEDLIEEKEDPLSTECKNSETSQDQPEIRIRREKRRETFTTKDRIRTKKRDLRECELYAKLLAQKLLKFGERERLTLMNKIDNLVFQTAMRSRASTERRRKLDSRSSYADDDMGQTSHSDEETRTSFEIDLKEEIDDFSA